MSLPVEQLSYQPHIVRVRGFLTEDECNHLVEISKNKLRPCNEISAGVNRTGWGVFLQKPDENNNIIQRIFQRMGKFVPVNNDSEVMQVIRYKTAPFFSTLHYLSLALSSTSSPTSHSHHFFLFSLHSLSLITLIHTLFVSPLH